MPVKIIKLEGGEWELDDTAPLGPPGGFGEVFRGTGDGGPVAIKRLKLSAAAAAHRELNIGAALSGRSLTHVVPILDLGQDSESDRYFLVMPICERSLQEEITARGELPFDDACGVARDILMGLTEVGDIVHRDLKPGNVLFYEGRWRIADFGIAKFVEDSTSLETLRESLTPRYAAPEQWQGQRPTKATDIYAVGCIMHAMLSGAPPYVGDVDDVREAHLHKAPPPLSGASNRIAAIVSQMLRKVPASRPTLERCSAVFAQEEKEPVSAAHPALAEAANAVAVMAAEREAAEREAQARDDEWRALTQEARREFAGIIERLFDTICAASEEAKRTPRSLSFGKGHLIVSGVDDMSRNPAGGPNLGLSGWTVASHATFTLRATSRDYEWGATLFYAATPQDPSFRWREAAFFAWSSVIAQSEPFSLPAYSREFDMALSNVTGRFQAAVGPAEIDGEDEEEFHRRWVALLTRAAVGTLARPERMPVPKEFFG
jgi:serine/threonine-protein kinase